MYIDTAMEPQRSKLQSTDAVREISLGVVSDRRRLGLHPYADLQSRFSALAECRAGSHFSAESQPTLRSTLKSCRRPDRDRLLRDNQGDNRVASFRNAPERAGHCLTRMLPMRRHFVNQKSNDFYPSGSVTNGSRVAIVVGPERHSRVHAAAREACFPVRSVSLLSRPDLATPKPRRAT